MWLLKEIKVQKWSTSHHFRELFY